MNPPRSNPPPLASLYPTDDGGDSDPPTSTEGRRPPIERGQSGDRRWWRVGGDRVEMAPTQGGWSAEVHRANWDGLPLNLGGIFPDEAVTLRWCERMACVLAEDARDEAGGDPLRN